MNQLNRKNIILEKLSKEGTLTISKFADMLQVSEMTVRRDISALEKEAKVLTFYGGVSLNPDYSVDSRVVQNGENDYCVERESLCQSAEKNRIANKAASLIEPSDVLFIDMGSTCQLILDYIDDGPKHIVYTYSLDVFNKCRSKENIRTVLCGGYFYENTRMFEGPEGILTLENANYNKAFFGTMGITQNGVSVVHSYEVMTRKASLKTDSQKILLADSTKMGKEWRVTYGEISDFDIIITDDKISTEHAKMIEGFGVELIVV